MEQTNGASDLVFNQFSIKIIDDGNGIRPENLKKLFVDFSQLKEH